MKTISNFGANFPNLHQTQLSGISKNSCLANRQVFGLMGGSSFSFALPLKAGLFFLLFIFSIIRWLVRLPAG